MIHVEGHSKILKFNFFENKCDNIDKSMVNFLTK